MYLRNQKPITCVDCGRLVPAGGARIWRARINRGYRANGSSWIGACLDKRTCLAKPAADPPKPDPRPAADAITIDMSRAAGATLARFVPATDSEADPLGLGY